MKDNLINNNQLIEFVIRDLSKGGLIMGYFYHYYSNQPYYHETCSVMYLESIGRLDFDMIIDGIGIRDEE
jgi:hypothetical protein